MFKICFFLLSFFGTLLQAFDSSFYQHSIQAINPENLTLTLTDSSVWQIDKIGFKDLEAFSVDDHIFITINNNCLKYIAELPTDYPFRLINQKTKTCINCKTLFCPLIDNPSVRSLALLDLEQKNITLSDQLTFALHPNDLSVYQSWQTGDLILLGVNSEWLTTCKMALVNLGLDQHYFNVYPTILINLSTNSYVRAKPF
jgi:hypothetical protein